jgi:hypothetical protein
VRVTREKLIDLAREEAERRGQTEDIVSGYLIGSVTGGEPFISGSADIDLVLIHQYEPERRREFVPLSENIHLDITHHNCELYSYPPDLRIHPWLGPSMCEPIFLYDPDHFFERAQAGVRGQFYRIDFVLERSSSFLERARNFRTELLPNCSWIRAYLNSILEAANAVATLEGFPVAGRRMALILQDRLNELGIAEQFAEFQRLLGGDLLPKDSISNWLTTWEAAYDAAGYLDPAFNQARKNYYLKGFQSLVELEHPDAMLWNLITSWNEAVEVLERTGEFNQHITTFEEVLTQLDLSYGFRDTRDAELEHYLDDIEDLLENWT